MKTGDKVSAIDDTVNGVITGIEGKVITILTDDGFELQYSEKELIIVENLISDELLNFDRISGIVSEKEEKRPKKAKKVRSKERNLPPMEVDLHIHQLVNNNKRMSNYDMLTLQLDTAKRQLDFAISKRIQKIVFIHGMGEGVLRAELEFLFKRYDNIKFYDADFQKYGLGAMEVYIFQNKTPN
jgi:dsDNA-specific endonuclease/ATPase MutS2